MGKDFFKKKKRGDITLTHHCFTRYKPHPSKYLVNFGEATGQQLSQMKFGDLQPKRV